MTKYQKVKVIFIMAVVIIALVIVISYKIEAGSQKLPAVVRADKIFVSAQAKGIFTAGSTEQMQYISAGDVIARLKDNGLSLKLETLRQEKSKYENLILSSSTGDILKLKTTELDRKLLENRLDLQKAYIRQEENIEELKIRSQSFNAIQKEYLAYSRLYESGNIAEDRYNKSANEYLHELADFRELQSDSLIISEKISTIESIIELLTIQQEILLNNDNILAGKYLIELDKVNSKIIDLESEIEELTIISPISGVITDINYRSGEVVEKGEVIAEIADMRNIWITAYGNSYSRQKINEGNKVKIYYDGQSYITGKVTSVSPVMEKVKSLSSSSETANTYSKINITFDDINQAIHYVVPGQRLFVRVNLT